MADTLGKIVARVPAATSSTSNLFAAERALTAGVGHIFVVSDLNHLMNVTATGPVFTHQGKVGFYRGVNGSTSSLAAPMTSPPPPSEVTWTPPGPDPGSWNYRVTFRVDAIDNATLPTLRLRCWVVAPPSGTESVGVVMCIGPTVLPSDELRYTSAVSSNTSGEDVTLELAVLPSDLQVINTPVSLGYTATGVPVIGEPRAETVLNVMIGFINTSNKNSDTANVLGVSLSLEAP